MTRPLVLAAGSLLDCDTDTVMACAAGAGFEGVGLRISDQHRLIDPAGTRWRADRLGLMIHDVEVHRIASDSADPGPMIEQATSIDASALLVVSDAADRPTTIRALRELTDRCSTQGLRIGLEYMAWTNPSEPGPAIEIALEASCSLIVDLLHHVRVGAGTSELDAIVEAGVLGWVQLCDAPLAPPADRDLIHEARHGRLLPGRGGLPLRALLDHVPTDIVVSVEVQSDSLLSTPPDVRSRMLHDAARSVLDS